MAFTDVLLGLQTYTDYVSSQEQIKGFEQALARRETGSVQIGLNQSNLQRAVESGLGSLSDNVFRGLDQVTSSIEFGFDQLAGGIAELNADFNLLMGDVIWKLQLQQGTLNNILKELQLTETQRESRAFRISAMDSYKNGWYEKALREFIEAERRNFKDYQVQRCIGNIYLYHIIDLSKALEWFSKAAKYAKAYNVKQAAEVNYFAGIVCGIKGQFEDALEFMEEAITLNPKIYEAYYMHAGFASMLRNTEKASESLKSAIHGDLRYFQRASSDPMLNCLKEQEISFFDQFLKQSQDEVLQTKDKIEATLNTHYITLAGKHTFVHNTLRTVNDLLPITSTYKQWCDIKQLLSRIETEFSSGGLISKEEYEKRHATKQQKNKKEHISEAEKEERAKRKLDKKRQRSERFTAGLCVVCGDRLNFFERLIKKTKCKIHD